MFALPRPNELLPALAYRRPMMVRELIVYTTGIRIDSYYRCPRCRITMEREFMKYCDRCGQCLDWSHYDWAKIVRPGAKKRGARTNGP